MEQTDKTKKAREAHRRMFLEAKNSSVKIEHVKPQNRKKNKALGRKRPDPLASLGVYAYEYLSDNKYGTLTIGRNGYEYSTKRKETNR